jgi:hypothetical protein
MPLCRDRLLRRALLSALQRCFLYDSDGFVTQERFDRLVPVLVAQIAHPCPGDDALVVAAIAQLAVTVGDDVRHSLRGFLCLFVSDE